MKAYKFWHDTRHFIHKSTTDKINVFWTTDINEALDVDEMYKGSGLPTFSKAVRFFHDTLGFSLNISRPDPLYFS